MVYANVQECTDTGRQVSPATIFCRVTPNICGSPIRNLHYVSLLALNNFEFASSFLKNSFTLACVLTFDSELTE